MVSLEAVQSPLGSNIDAPSSPRISFQADFLEASIFSSIITPDHDEEQDPEERAITSDFEFLSSNNVSLNNNHNSSSGGNNMTLLTADELFCEGKILPFWQMQQHSEKLKNISLRAKEAENEEEEEEEDEDGEKENNPVKEEQEQVIKKEEGESNKVMNWLVDEDPSPRPPNCTVLWKELLRLKKQRSSSSVSVLSPSSSSSSSSSLSDTASKQEGINKEKKQVMKGMKKLERTRSTSIRIRPMINVPICTQVKTSSLPPLFSHKKRK